MGSDVGALLDRVDQLVTANEAPLHSVVAVLESTPVPSANIARWAVQKYHQTYEQVRGFSAIHVATSSPEVRAFQVAQIVAEETGYEDGSSSHHEMMRRFALAAGASEAEFEPSRASDVVRHFVEHRVELCLRDPLSGVLAFYILERQTPWAAARLLDVLSGTYGFAANDLDWFAVHATADVEHSNSARDLLAAVGPTVAGWDERALDVTLDTCREWRTLQEHYYACLTS